MSTSSLPETRLTGEVQSHNQRPASVWSSGGRDYDAVSAQIASAIDHCVIRLNPKPGERILDLATGTGWTSRQVARRGAKVRGADIAADLLAAARERAAAERLDIEYGIGDAEQLPFEDASFDGVISTFGVMFASRPESVARELTRVVRPGGRIALATWTADGTVFKMFQVMRAYMPPPPTPAPPSPFDWGRPERVQQLFKDGFSVKFEHGVTVYYEADGQAAWRAFVTGYGPTKMLAGSLDESRRKELERDFVAFHNGYATDLGVAIPREYLISVGRRA